MGSDPHHGNLILCRFCFCRENDYRRERNKALAKDFQFETPTWETLKVYGQTEPQALHRCFTRTFWKEAASPGWPNNREPHLGEKDYTNHPDNLTEDEARAYCKQWNATHDQGPYSLKAEFEEQ